METIAEKIKEWYCIENAIIESEMDGIDLNELDAMEYSKLLAAIKINRGIVTVDDTSSSDPSIEVEFDDGSGMRILNPKQSYGIARHLLCYETK